MKKTVFIIACSLFFITLGAQEKSKTYIVYGIDYAHTKVHAADESVDEFARAFEAINSLLISEPDKYDFSRMVNSKVQVNIEPILKKLSTTDYAQLTTYSTAIEPLDCAPIVAAYDLPHTEGIGVVLIAKMLNKAKDKATYDIVLFDIATREILIQREAVGDAGGFGLRNFWANSVYKILKRTRLYK